MYNDVATHSMLIYRIILFSLQLLVGASAGADSKGETVLGMYATDNTLCMYTATKELVLYTYNIPSLVPRPSLPPVFMEKRFCILQAVKNWRWVRLGNKAIIYHGV